MTRLSRHCFILLRKKKNCSSKILKKDYILGQATERTPVGGGGDIKVLEVTIIEVLHQKLVPLESG